MSIKPDEVELMRRVLDRCSLYDGRFFPEGEPGTRPAPPCFYKHVTDVAHEKRVFGLLLKWAGRGWWDYGIHSGCGWPTDEGKKHFRNIVYGRRDE